MNRQEKQTCISDARDGFLQSSATFVVGVQGLTVHQIQVLRAKVRREQGRLQVVKNTLGRRALEGAPELAGLEDFLRNQIALVFTQGDPVAVARVLCESAKEYERLKLVAGTLGSRVIAADMVRYLGSLPSYEVVVARACGALKAPLAKHVGLLRQLLVRFLFVLQQCKKAEPSSD